MRSVELVPPFVSVLVPMLLENGVQLGKVTLTVKDLVPI